MLAASDGESALELYRKERTQIDLVILDLIMPGMGGKKCMEQLLQIDPQAKVLIATGYTPDGPTRKALESGAKGLISKPFNMRQMVQEIRDVLDEDLK